MNAVIPTDISWPCISAHQPILGLRISEALALKWSDVDWLNGTIRVERGIVQQIADDVKTDDSRKTLTIAGELLNVLKAWKQRTKISEPEHWVFASPVQLGTAVVLHRSEAGTTEGR